MNHSTSKRTAKALPQVESTMLVENITKKVIKCTARKAFSLGNSHIAEGETFFLVASERRAQRYYVVHFNSGRNQYQCSCGANCKSHEHITTTQQYVVEHVVNAKAEKTAQVVESSSQVSVPQTEQYDGSRKLTADEWKAIAKADRKRQQAWQDEYRQQVAALAG